jgi:hypothetical protein
MALQSNGHGVTTHRTELLTLTRSLSAPEPLKRCCNSAARVLQECYKGVTRVLQECCKSVITVL